MDLFLAICQGLGLALAIGVGGALAALFVSVMGSLEAGFDPEGTDYGFSVATWFLVTLLALVVLSMLARGKEAARLPIVALLSAAGAIAFADDSCAIRVICAANDSGGKVDVSGSPPASEITSGRAVISIRSRIAEERITWVRCANSPA